ncbi:hypothetical protein GUITHDRAFT_107112 [Guillardia theta CCMP2712]|uniref:Uncharacterized protein n=1 Tax=Guillardia theta (strain CCMP2712) TaxID=905079 RepID=L1JFC0_GUITC|nr:hypothetical protein GUITHDRAFT_107112 [Guillardia theta CCMP2712]EKX47201.1 hypothetical protein GUITHDRAFT_107112 [Guillardia theta CCMP2712]|eukprot:XP_005834181.1 hypothetical protein GUITHDRAFT_107112 [Guillardia theta CCMP2712]
MFAQLREARAMLSSGFCSPITVYDPVSQTSSSCKNITECCIDAGTSNDMESREIANSEFIGKPGDYFPWD